VEWIPRGAWSRSGRRRSGYRPLAFQNTGQRSITGHRQRLDQHERRLAAILRRPEMALDGSGGRPGLGACPRKSGNGTVFVATARRFMAGSEPAFRPTASAPSEVGTVANPAVIWPPLALHGDPVNLHVHRMPPGTDNAGR
jgi:hypothetical protein